MGTCPCKRLYIIQHLVSLACSQNGIQLSLLNSLTEFAWRSASRITLAALFCSLRTRMRVCLSQLVQTTLEGVFRGFRWKMLLPSKCYLGSNNKSQEQQNTRQPTSLDVLCKCSSRSPISGRKERQLTMSLLKLMDIKPMRYRCVDVFFNI